jgi:hypothetical protein
VIVALALLQRPQQSKREFENVNVRRQFSHIEPNTVPPELRFPSLIDSNGRQTGAHDKKKSEAP